MEVTVRNATASPVAGHLELTVAGSSGGSPLASARRPVALPTGATTYRTTLPVPDVQPWTLDRPALYRLTARLETANAAPDQLDARFGFRDVSFRDGYFRLNDERLILKGTHTVGHYPIGLMVPPGPEMLRQELLNLKLMGLNCCRSLGRLMYPAQLDFCDELGLLVYEETLAAWNWQSSPRMAQRFDAHVRDMILRDRNHPSVVAWGVKKGPLPGKISWPATWGLLNETFDGDICRHAAGMLPSIRDVDPTRLVFLNSGRWDAFDASRIGLLNTARPTEVQAMLQGTKTSLGAAALPHQAEWSAGFADYHRYVRRPLQDEAITTFGEVGTSDYRLFQSEYGNGSAIDPVRITRLFEQSGARDDLDDGTLYRRMAGRLEEDFRRLGIDEVFATPSDLVRASETLHAENWALGIAALRANPNLCGYSMTGMLDHTMVGEGLMTIYREPKQATIDALRDAWQPLQWSIFVDRTSLYRGAHLRVEAVLVNEDQLQPGRYPVRLRLAGPTGIVFETTRELVIPSADSDTEPDVVYPVFDERIVLDGPPGRYDVRAFFERGGAAIGRAHVYVSDVPGPVAGEVVVWDAGDKLSDWLRSRGLTVTAFDPTRIGPFERTVLVNAPDIRAEHDAFAPLLEWIAAGGTAAFLSPRVFGHSEEDVHGVFSTGWLAWCPFGRSVGLKQARGCWWAVDHVVKAHPLVAGLPSRILMDPQYYRAVHPWWIYVGLDGADVAIAGLGIGTCGEEDNYWAGQISHSCHGDTGVHPLGVAHRGTRRERSSGRPARAQPRASA